jgi:hypothetical protein
MNPSRLLPFTRCVTEEFGKSFVTEASYSPPRGSVRPEITRISFALSDSDDYIVGPA